MLETARADLCDLPHRLSRRDGDLSARRAALPAGAPTVGGESRRGPRAGGASGSAFAPTMPTPAGGALTEPAPAPAAAAAEDGFDSLIGAVLAGRYQIVRRIGEGGMGAVYEAKHTLIGKRVAVKVLLEKFLAKSDFVARLLQEARLASSIGHENIVDVTDFGTTDDGRSFVVMEFLDGESLAELTMREAPLPIERSLRIARQVASALGAAHAKGIFHRDVKPENIYLVRRGDADFVKVVDFGISKAVKPGGDEGGEGYRLTHTGLLLGTPLYMSPEQARGEEDLDHRVDIWALGVLLYECLTGEVPFRANNYLQIISQVLTHDADAAVAAAARAGHPRRGRGGGDARDGEGPHPPLPDDGRAGARPRAAARGRSERRPAAGRRGRRRPVRAAAPKRWPLVLLARLVLAGGVALGAPPPGVRRSRRVRPPPPAPAAAARPAPAPAAPPARRARPVPSLRRRPRPPTRVRPARRAPRRPSRRVAPPSNAGDDRLGQAGRAPVGLAKRAIRISDPPGWSPVAGARERRSPSAAPAARADDAHRRGPLALRDGAQAVRRARARAGADRVHQGQRDQAAPGGGVHDGPVRVPARPAQGRARALPGATSTEMPDGEFAALARDRIESIDKRKSTFVDQHRPRRRHGADLARGRDRARSSRAARRPTTSPIPRGRYRVDVTKPNYQGQTRIVDVDIAETKPLFFKLEPIPARLEIETVAARRDAVRERQPRAEPVPPGRPARARRDLRRGARLRIARRSI